METYDVPLVVLSVLIVATNLTVCALVYRTQSLRTYTNGFVVSLAISDVLTGGVFFPCHFAKVSFNGYVVSIVLLAGVANICLVTFDRYIAVLKPLRYIEIIRKHFTRLIVGSWVTAVGFSLVPLIWKTDTTNIAHRVYMVFHQLAVVVPHIFIFFTYYRIFHQVKRCILRERDCLRFREIKNRLCWFSHEAKYIQIFTIVAAMFVLSWLPIVYMTAVAWFGRTDLIPNGLPVISHYTIAFGSLVNPIVYSFKKPDFRKAIGKLLTKKGRAAFRQCNNGRANQQCPTTSMLSTKESFCETKV